LRSPSEAFALLTGMGPTYLWFQLETLRGLAEASAASADITPALKRTVAARPGHCSNQVCRYRSLDLVR
jgi:hypothetical protein